MKFVGKQEGRKFKYPVLKQVRKPCDLTEPLSLLTTFLTRYKDKDGELPKLLRRSISNGLDINESYCLNSAKWPHFTEKI